MAIKKDTAANKGLKTKIIFSSLTFYCGGCIFAACGGENAFKFLYHFRTTPCNNNKKQEAMKINTLQKPSPKHLIAFRRKKAVFRPQSKGVKV